jgi:hypothetical protein
VLGLDHFEGRSWFGLHHHALLTMLAFAFPQLLRLSEASLEPLSLTGPPPQPSLPAVRWALLRRLEVALRVRCLRCGKRWCGLDVFP